MLLSRRARVLSIFLKRFHEHHGQIAVAEHSKGRRRTIFTAGIQDGLSS